jgi:predicted Rossmann fold flavoprotein
LSRVARYFDVIVLGGGAAGLMCAIEAGKRGRKVLLIERNDRLGRKILISGGGRCNFTNVDAGPDNYLSTNPDFCRSALARYTPADFVALVEQHGIAYHEKKLGQLFCDGSARQIVDMLEAECALAGVEIVLGCDVDEVRRGEAFGLETNYGAFAGRSLVIATGGLSIAKLGATDFGYRIAKQFDLAVVEPRPGLVPLTFDGDELSMFSSLAGVSVDAVVRIGRQSFRENVLFTHRGLSGPAILQASSYWRPGQALTIDLLPSKRAHDLLEAHRTEARDLPAILGDQLPRRFAQAWAELYDLSRPVGEMSDRELELAAQRLEGWQVWPTGSEGFAKAEVTVGGVDTRELSSQTMEARKVPGLFFIGEAVDVTGWLGGYNFQWAWASGAAAGRAV